MTTLFKTAAVVAALAATPFAANAATVTDVVASQDINSSDTFRFQMGSVDGDAGATQTFDFINGSSTSSTVAITLATVKQFLGAYTDGVEFTWSTGGALSIAEGETGNGTFDTVIGASETATLTLTYGDFTGNGDGDIDFSVAAISAVPLPAGGLLLLSAFGAVAVARRKKA